jgi:hypothetical protein
MFRGLLSGSHKFRMNVSRYWNSQKVKGLYSRNANLMDFVAYLKIEDFSGELNPNEYVVLEKEFCTEFPGQENPASDDSCSICVTNYEAKTRIIE